MEDRPQSAQNRIDRAAGITLVELMVALGVAALCGLFVSKFFESYSSKAKSISDLNDAHSFMQQTRFEIAKKFEMRTGDGYQPFTAANARGAPIEGFSPKFPADDPDSIVPFGTSFTVRRARTIGYDETTWSTVCRPIPTVDQRKLAKVRITDIATKVSAMAVSRNRSSWKTSDSEVRTMLGCPTGQRPTLRIYHRVVNGAGAPSSSRDQLVPPPTGNSSVMTAGVYFGKVSDREYYVAVESFALSDGRLVPMRIQLTLPLVDENPYSGNNLPGTFEYLAD